MTIKALIFDFDGLILDTETPEYHAWQKVYQMHGAHLELSEWLACVGTSQEAFDPVVNLRKQVSVPLADNEILKARDDFFEKEIWKEAAMPGVLNYLSDAKELGLRLAIASSSQRSWVARFLGHLEMQDMFEFICSSDDVENVKPDPALYRCAVDRLGIQPGEAIAFEDSLNGLLSAKKAGLYCVAVPNFVTRQLDFTLADKIIHSLEEANLQDLLHEFNNHR